LALQLAVKGESDFCSDRQAKVPIVTFWFYFPVLGSIWMILVPNGTSSLPKVKFRLPFGRIGFQTEPKTSRS
jgi:hypothetical protein